MPVNKKDNKKNAPVEKRDSAIVPPKEEANKEKSKSAPGQQTTIANKRTNALSTAGKKKKPK